MAHWPMLVFIGLVIVLVALVLTLSFLLGQRHQAGLRDVPYETGVAAEPFPEGGFPVEFYRMAVFFVVFDVEAVFIFAWAVAVRETGWTAFAGMMVFIALLFAALGYLWRLGSLDWRADSWRRRRQ